MNDHACIDLTILKDSILFSFKETLLLARFEYLTTSTFSGTG